jgi:undecaprenyl-diphosphatase
MDWLVSLDRSAFVFFNTGLANPLGDAIWPLITHYDRYLLVRLLLAAAWIMLLVRGGRKGRTAALLLVPVILISDQLSSSVLKELVGRARPCHTVDGAAVMDQIRLLVDCGPGKSFPSSHAVNNFAFAALFAAVYPALRGWFFAWALLVGYSRIAVGVHFPLDVLGGAVVGLLVARLVLGVWKSIEERLLALRPPRPPAGEGPPP